VPKSVIPATDLLPAPQAESGSFTLSCHGLLELLLAVSDGRSDQDELAPSTWRSR
jgi:hypothetical protein